MADLATFQKFVNNLQRSTPYKNWSTANPKDAGLWLTYSKAILSGGSPTPPAMSSVFGVALAQVGVLALESQLPSHELDKLQDAIARISVTDKLTQGAKANIVSTGPPTLSFFGQTNWPRPVPAKKRDIGFSTAAGLTSAIQGMQPGDYIHYTGTAALDADELTIESDE